MIICGSLSSNKTELLVEQYVQLVKNGISSQNILFLTLNAHKKEKISKLIKSYLSNVNPVVQTFLGLCYNSILSNKEILEEKMPKSIKKEFTLCGLEASQNLLLQSINEVGFKDYNSKINLVHQLLRRHALIVNNNLSDKDIDEKSIVLNEVFANDAKKALDLFKLKTIELRAFDYLRQQSLFKWLYEHTSCCKDIQYLFIDDYDEQTPACTDFYKFIKPQLKDYFIGIDKNGSTRCGYLCADLNCTSILDKSEKIINATESNKEKSFEFFNYSKRLEMLNSTVNKINGLISSGVSSEEISIISPCFDNQFKFILKNKLDSANIAIQFISGSEKLSDDNFIRSVLNFLKLINGIEKELFANTDILNNIFPTLLNIPQKHAVAIIKNFHKTKGFLPHDFNDEELNKNYNKFLSIATIINPQDTLSEQLKQLFNEIIISRKNTDEELANFDFLLKQIRDLELTSNVIDKEKILNQIGNSIIAENDIQGQKIQKNAVILGTPQKIIDFEIGTKYQFWLDVSSDEWIKQDTGTIYNAWVFARSWQKKEFTYEDSLNCIEEKTKRILRKLKLLAKEKIYTYASSYNSLGLENNIGIVPFLKPKEQIEKKETTLNFKFEPREDQKAVFSYTSGNMALSAVPGAGKTTVLQALIIDLINKGVIPEKIFVLTYMDSAAKTLKERLLKNFNCDESSSAPDILPAISTIHGLALRIIKENGNFIKIGLNENFEICDEVLRQKIIHETISELNLNHEEYEKYDKGISIAKFVTVNTNPKTKEVKDFLAFYNLYHSKLRDKNLIDYDDMLILAVKLLENNPQILNYYQNICEYILEDEAQDSSQIQQKLISLLAGKNGNIIRCGDINQAITSTFTNADTKGFRAFIENNFSVEMTQSQRCAKQIFELANNLIDISKTLNPLSDGAFFDIKMQEVKGKNPISQNPLFAKIFETDDEEQAEIISKIKNILKTSPTSSIAILVRNNFQVAKYNAILKQEGFNVLSKSDYLEQNRVFNIILSVLKFCIFPWKNNLVQDVYKNLFDIKNNNEFLENLEVPFININSSELCDENLITLHWELNYWLNKNNLPPEQLALNIGEYYSRNDIERSNLYIIAELVRKFAQNSNSYTQIVSKLEQVSKRPIIAGLKLFSEDENSLINTNDGGKIQIMTMHKSKGDEFDYVFVPEFTEKNLASTLKHIKTGNNVGFFEDIKCLDKKYKRKTLEEQKQEILHENLRLLYVTITRAKKYIMFSSSLKQKMFGRLRDVEKSELFDALLSQYQM